ncbi:hypothetical protein [Salipiger bermudensis]|uniref:hypothetical protein n=1 Tax=Salipiger bermudensis TaxID=344736 RepID=UPI001A901EC7|nr:hypothetical protein [Salipiger bermudensis]MBN9676442.1 hypothetical protein [Salipiger bermudensis]
MAVFEVTTETWDDPDFWAMVTTAPEPNMLDFSALPGSFTISFARDGAFLSISDGAESYVIGDNSVGAGADAYLGAPGDFGLFEVITGSAGRDVIDGNDESELIDGGAGDDSILGYGGDDALTGGLGADTLRGGGGNDTVSGNDGDDVIYGNEGDDSLLGGDGADSIYGEYGDDYVEGGAGDDHLEGNEGKDTLIGGDGDDWMRGSYDDDALWGGTGDDYLWGGYGDDTFHIENGFGNDTVDAEDVDETTGDVLDLTAVTDGLRLDLTSADPESGSLTDGSSTLVFSQVESILLGAGEDTIALADFGGLDSVTGFAAPELQPDGSYLARDVLDVSELTDFDGSPVDTDDVTVTDTVGDGSGDAVLSFPGGEAITLLGVTADAVKSAAQLEALGIPAATDEAPVVVPPEKPSPDAPDDGDDGTEADGGGSSPPPDAVDLPQIDGAFEFEATLRVDDLAGGHGQTVFEYGGGGPHAITFGQIGQSSAMMLEIVQDGATHYIVAEEALVAGETATWTAGIDETGQMYIDKNGMTLAEDDGVVPADVERLPALLGDSALETRSALVGEIGDVSLAQGETVWPEDEAPDDTPEETPAEPTDPEDAPDPEETEDDAPAETPDGTPEEPPAEPTDPEDTPDPEETEDDAPDDAPDDTPEETPAEPTDPEDAPDPEETEDDAPADTPDDTPEETPAEPTDPEDAPDPEETEDDAPGETPGEAPATSGRDAGDHESLADFFAWLLETGPEPDRDEEEEDAAPDSTLTQVWQFFFGWLF